jgi:hypothetical protein
MAGAFLCIALVGVVTRASVADAILARGDDAARAGRFVDAVRYYERADVVGGTPVAVLDRLALLALLAPRGRLSASTMTIANAFLAAHPGDAGGRFDRGLIEWRDHDYMSAAADFGLVAKIDGDPRARAFASAARRRARSGAPS